ncbi:MAG: DNA phosphorothioation-associated putative methyltransferase [Armatimonadia bacterium]
MRSNHTPCSDDDIGAARHRTAKVRNDLSRPVRAALDSGILSAHDSFLDYGCGRGDDLRLLSARGIRGSGWDPVHRPEGTRGPAEVVNLGYVVNVIEDPAERLQVLQEAWSYAQKVLVVSARLTLEAKDVRARAFGDGCVTSRGTFQKFYTQHELRDWLEASLQAPALAAAPGIFFLFRDESLYQSFAAARFRRVSAAPRQQGSDELYAVHQELLQPLMRAYADHGRLPDATEIAEAGEISAVFSSLARAFAVVRRATGDDQWRQIEEERRQDLLVYLALGAFGRRPKFSALPPSLQLDVKGLFGSYTQALKQADGLLFSAGRPELVDAACRTSSCGKLTHDALYVHVDALDLVPAVLRVYEGCARACFGRMEGANIIKLGRGKPRISYLSYPDFEKDPHPALRTSLLVSLDDLDLSERAYGESDNPPILHRKEEFVAPDNPLRARFQKLTAQEERAGLYEDTHTIGTRNGWQKALEAKGLRLTGHRLVKSR